jgi:hypothetical protein
MDDTKELRRMLSEATPDPRGTWYPSPVEAFERSLARDAAARAVLAALPSLLDRLDAAEEVVFAARVLRAALARYDEARRG